MTQHIQTARVATTAERPRRRRITWRLPVLIVGALVFLFPFYYMLIGSLQTKVDSSPSGAFPHPGNISLGNYHRIDSGINLARGLVNSGIFTGGVLLGTLVFGILA